jgi:hypothetical protein
MNLSGNLKPIYDNGKLGMTEAQMYLLTDDEPYLQILNSKLYRFIFKICKWSGFNIDKIFHNIPYITEFVDEKNIYNIFNITEEEQKMIEDTL